MIKSELKTLIGWQEWCSLPELKTKYIKAKIDTGAKTSALHAFNIKEKIINKKKFVVFDIHPVQDNDKIIVSTKAEVVDRRYVISSNGTKEKRYVIKTKLHIADVDYDIELTLTNRDSLRFRMLLGREALKPYFIIDPEKMSCLTKYSSSFVKKFYS
tara:strand:+ start:3423 stop:3893 length:471 start_codon:yes stop_codon:yes gene_type:complete